MSFFNRNNAAQAPLPSAPAPMQSGAPAISLKKVQASAPGLVDLYKKAGVSLQKKGLTGQRAAVYLVLDRSGSMGLYYRDGSAQRLAEQALGLSAQLDDDGIVPLVFFDHGAYRPVSVQLTNYAGVVNRENARLGPMGGTAYAPAMRAVIDHYEASGATDPAFVIFQTDGEPGDERETQQLLKDASSLPIFWQFVGFGRSFRFLAKLDTLRGRHVDNAGFFAVGSNPQTIGDEALYDQLMAEYPQWLTAARSAGVL